MSNSYKTLLGLSDVDADVIVAEMISTQDLKAENMDVNNAIINKLTIPNGGEGMILTLYWRLHFWIFRFALLDL